MGQLLLTQARIFLTYHCRVAALAASRGILLQPTRKFLVLLEGFKGVEDICDLAEEAIHWNLAGARNGFAVHWAKQ